MNRVTLTHWGAITSLIAESGQGTDNVVSFIVG